MNVAPHSARRIIAIALIVIAVVIILIGLVGILGSTPAGEQNGRVLSQAGLIVVGLALGLTALGLMPSRPTEAAPAPARTRSTSSNLILLAASVIVTLLVCEVAVRMLGTFDERGQFYFMDQPMRPYLISFDEAEKSLARYFEEGDSYTLYDPDLGWVLRPNSTGEKGLHHANGAGIRSNREYSLKPEPGVLRIALFGDSYTHGSNVSFEDSWGNQLELMLRDRGIPAEVLNFGVPGYGIDQAYLRWQRDGRPYDPDIVIFGFRAPDVYRDFNIFRVLYSPGTGSPFSKPRFVLQPDGSLRIINQPTVPPEEILDTLKHFQNSPLAPYENWYDDAYSRYWWLNSKLVAVIDTLIVHRYRNEEVGSEEFYLPTGEGGELAKAIVDQFAAEVEASGSQFLIVTMPDEDDFKAQRNNEPLLTGPLLQAFDDEYRVAYSERYFDPTAKKDDYFGGHYTPLGNRIMAEAALDQILEILDSGAVDTSHP